VNKSDRCRFSFLYREITRFVHTLFSFFLDETKSDGCIEFMYPILVNTDSATAIGQLPDKERMIYWSTQGGLCLVPTAEIPMTDFFAMKFSKKNTCLFFVVNTSHVFDGKLEVREKMLGV
jgi:seryl-tRNA synthetase